MSNQKPSGKKINSVGGIKMLILAGSLAVTLGGWGVIAADQLNSATTQTAFNQSAPTQSSTASTQQRFNQLPSAQVSPAPRALTRTRSSR